METLKPNYTPRSQTPREQADPPPSHSPLQWPAEARSPNPQPTPKSVEILRVLRNDSE